MDILRRLVNHPEALIRLKAQARLTGQEASPASSLVTGRASPLAQSLLSEVDADGRIPLHPYAKWRGAHWVLACLADLDYPPGDERLKPLLEQVYAWLLSPHHLKSVAILQGRARRCASQEGNALFAALKLGLADDRAEELAARLLKWQWPDGGWNCDKKPEAHHASFMESLIPLRALALYARQSGDPVFWKACEAAAQIFLKRELFKRQRDGSVIQDDFLNLHYPCYWHYDILFGLKVMAEAGFIEDKRCQAALVLLRSKQLPSGGYPMEGSYYRVSEKVRSGRSLVDWKRFNLPGEARANTFVTLDALYVLQEAPGAK
ncbi:MAG: hypothetical protein PHD58_04125 [Anaerolineales bacterium]|nr:hypothetical protein [Anaerolineales bacterium]